MRKLGHQLIFSNTSLDYLVQQKNTILSAIKQHGVVCIPNAAFKPKDLLQFTQTIFDEIFVLPASMAFKNKDKQYYQVSRIGNVLPDGSLKDASQEAVYYHSDGNFLGCQNNNLFNVMHSVEQPNKGGETLFIDLVKAVDFLKQKRPNIYTRLTECKGVLDFQQIPDFYLYGTPDLSNRPQIHKSAKFQIINKYNFNNSLVAYLSVNYFQEKKTGMLASDIIPHDIIEYLHKEMGYYSHSYKHGDLLLWDNIQTLHRSSGPYKGRRLIIKCHGKQKSKRQNLMEALI